MDPQRTALAVNRALEGRLLLEHPFYRRWEAGTLSAAELAAYAEQYRHVERALPGVLRAVADGLPAGPDRVAVQANLDDELGVPEPHAVLFEHFARAVGARPDVAPTPATRALVDLQVRTAHHDPAGALAMLAAYEVQATAIAASKSAGLSRHYWVDAVGTRFWDVHAAMEDDHAAWSLATLASLGSSEEAVEAPAAEAARAWWAFLDEREASAPAAA